MSSEISASPSHNDIAIIGMSCRLPGKSNSPQQFWNFLMQGGNGIVDVPPERWDSDAYFDADRNLPGKMYIKRGGFIEGLDQFDPQFFGISPKEAPHLDPQHRWLLELAYESFENAGLKLSDLKGSDTAVFIGQFMHDYEQIQLDRLARNDINSHSATGPSMTLTANRLSYSFDFTGPSVTLDTACSSSLVALDLACRAILNHDSKLALAGGVNILLRPELTMSICKASMLSPDMLCKSFDASANGYVRSEGAALVLLKRFDDALRDGDPVLAVIKATGVNQDGQTNGITVPNGKAQQQLLQKTLARAGFASSQIQYAEAHGTGTAVGDPIEVNALAATLGQRPADQATCVIGSVKSNIGHTEATAGVAALIKTVLAMQHGTIPKNLHLNEVNPAIDLDALNVRLAREHMPWPDSAGQSRKAIVNSFGFGGTNANVVLEQAPAPAARRSEALAAGRFHCLPLSGKSENSLKDNAARMLQWLDSNEYELADILYSTSLKREHFRQRAVVCGENRDQLKEGLRDLIDGKLNPALTLGTTNSEINPRPCFVFSGMGTTWAGMGRDLYASEPVYRAAMDRCDAALRPYTGWSLLEKMWQQDDPETIHQTEIAQPAIFSTQVALSALLAARGIEPACIVGHSAGEVAAAYVAGALDFDQAVAVIYHRSQLQASTAGMGKMLAVALTESALQPYLAGQEHKISVAAINSDDALTLSGDADVLAEIAAKLDEQGIFARFLKVDVPYHSPVMDQLRKPLEDALHGMTVQVPKLALYSTVSGALFAEGDFGAAYWPQNVREPVFFKRAIEAIAASGIDTFIEIAPNAALASSIQKNLQRPSLVVPTMKRNLNDALALAQTMAALHVAGFSPDWSRLLPASARFVPLPNWAWQHASYWHENDAIKQSRLKNSQSRNGFQDASHTLLGSKLISQTTLWQSDIDVQRLPWLADHLIEQEIVFPGAAYVENALAMASSLGQRHICLEQVRFQRALFLDRTKPLQMECTLDPASLAYQINALDPQSQSWQVFGNGSIMQQRSVTLPKPLALDSLRQQLPHQLDHEAFYQQCDSLGLNYQGSFRAVQQAWHDGTNSLVQLQLPDSMSSSFEQFHLHPSLLDGAFQSLFATVNSGYLPVRIGQLQYFQRVPKKAFAYLAPFEKTADLIRADLTICDELGSVAVMIRDIEVRSSKTRTRFADELPLYDYAWQEQPLPPTTGRTPGQWLLFADRHGVLASLANELTARGHTVAMIEQGKQFDQTGPLRFQTNLDSPASVLPILQQFATTAVGIVYGWAIDSRDHDCRHGAQSALALAQAIDQVNWQQRQRLFLLTRGAQQVAQEAVQAAGAALWGFGRVFANEHPEHGITLLDLELAADDNAVPAPAMLQLLANELENPAVEAELALRDQRRLVHRLRQLQEPALQAMLQNSLPLHSDHAWQWLPQDGSMQATACEIPLADHNQVLLQIGHVAMSDNANPAALQQCSAQVMQTGNGWQAGDDVMGFAASAHGSHALAPSALLVARPASLRPALAAALPEALICAHYCLHHLARLEQGQRVLIHAAHTLSGQIMVALAQAAGAHVFVTIEDSQTAQQTAQNKLSLRHALLAQGVCAVHGLDDFAQSLAISATNPGLDLVLNSLPSQVRMKSLALLRPFGTLIDLPTVPSEHSALPLPPQSALSHHVFQLQPLLQHAPQVARQCLQAALQQVDNSTASTALSQTLARLEATLPVTDANDGYKAAQSALRHTSLASSVLNCRSQPEQLHPGLLQQAVRPKRSYIVTGGLGGLGLEMMHWLAQQGAQSIVLLGRRAPDEQASQAIAKAQQQGVQITVLQADISVEADVARVFAHIAANLPPLAGIIHSAGVLQDGTLMQQTAAQFDRVMAPKVQGAWYLHQHSQHLALDFFILFSSIAAMLGWAGQSNYAAANAYMDSLARQRRAMGLAALSINWGPWRDAGMAARLDQRDSERMQEAGMQAISSEAGMAAMQRSLAYRLPQAGIFELDWSRIGKTMPESSRLGVFADFLDAGTNQAEVNLQETLLALEPSARAARLRSEMCLILAEVLGLDNADSIDPAQTVFTYGLNSLMGMDFKNRLQTKLQVKLPTTLVLKYPTLQAMAQFILENHLQQVTAAPPAEVVEPEVSLII